MERALLDKLGLPGVDLRVTRCIGDSNPRYVLFYHHQGHIKKTFNVDVQVNNEGYTELTFYTELSDREVSWVVQASLADPANADVLEVLRIRRALYQRLP